MVVDTRIGNYYGTLHIETEDGKFYWYIEDYCTTPRHEIPKSLYDELLKFEATNDRQT